MTIILLTLILCAQPDPGSAALLRGDWQGAVDAFIAVIEDKPTAKAYINRGIAYGRLRTSQG